MATGGGKSPAGQLCVQSNDACAQTPAELDAFRPLRTSNKYKGALFSSAFPEAKLASSNISEQWNIPQKARHAAASTEDAAAAGHHSPTSHAGSTDENFNPFMTEEQLAYFAKRPDVGEQDANEALSRVVDYINNHKLAGIKPLVSAGKSGSGTALKWVQPSGPRRPGEGTENEEQGILSAEFTSHRTVVIRVTLLAAGFIIGPSGTAVRDITRQTGAEIRSWTEKANGKLKRPCRVLVLEGPTKSLLHAVNVIFAAVQRYKQLAEGSCTGQSVSRVQRIMGVEFCYQPPPRSAVPCAASLKSTPSKSRCLIDAHVLSQHFQLMQYNASMGNMLDLQQNLMAAQAVMDRPTYLAMLNMLQQQQHQQQQAQALFGAHAPQMPYPMASMPMCTGVMAQYPPTSVPAQPFPAPVAGTNFVPPAAHAGMYAKQFEGFTNPGLMGGSVSGSAEFGSPHYEGAAQQIDNSLPYVAATMAAPQPAAPMTGDDFTAAAAGQDGTAQAQPAVPRDMQSTLLDVLCTLLSQARLGDMDLQQLLATAAVTKNVPINLFGRASAQSGLSSAAAVPAAAGNVLPSQPGAGAEAALHGQFSCSSGDSGSVDDGSHTTCTAGTANSSPVPSGPQHPSPSAFSAFSNLPIVQEEGDDMGQWKLNGFDSIKSSLMLDVQGGDCSLAQMARLSYTDPICSPIRKAASAPKGMLDRVLGSSSENLPSALCMLARSCTGMPDVVDALDGAFSG